MKKLLLTVLVLTGLLSVNVQPAHACSCIVPGSPVEEMENTTLVFSGTAVDVQSYSDAPGLSPMGYYVTFEVIDSWKGADANVVTVHTNGDSAACGYPFEEGEQYMVYATEFEGEFQVYSCGLTSLLAYADVSQLGEPTHMGMATESPSGSDNTPYIILAVALTTASYLVVYMAKR